MKKDIYSYNELDTEKLYETLELVREVFMEFEAPDYSAEGISEFLHFLDPYEIMELIEDEKMRIWTCNLNDQIIGMIAAGKEHINLLFVHSRHHRKGIAGNLLDIVIKYFNPVEVSVNSSPYAIEAYKRLGFVETGEEKTENGIRFTPMKKTFKTYY